MFDLQKSQTLIIKINIAFVPSICQMNRIENRLFITHLSFSFKFFLFFLRFFPKKHSPTISIWHNFTLIVYSIRLRLLQNTFYVHIASFNLNNLPVCVQSTIKRTEQNWNKLSQNGFLFSFRWWLTFFTLLFGEYATDNFTEIMKLIFYRSFLFVFLFYSFLH